jgi:hypothetical protein
MPDEIRFAVARGHEVDDARLRIRGEVGLEDQRVGTIAASGGADLGVGVDQPATVLGRADSAQRTPGVEVWRNKASQWNVSPAERCGLRVPIGP